MESEMRDAMLNAMNHPPGETVSDPIEIKFFQKAVEYETIIDMNRAGADAQGLE